MAKQQISILLPETTKPVTFFIDHIGTFAFLAGDRSILLIVDVDVVQKVRRVTLRSSIHFQNKCSVPIDILCPASEVDDLELLQSIQPEEKYMLPLPYISDEVYVRPSAFPFGNSVRPLQINRGGFQVLECPGDAGASKSFHLIANYKEDSYANFPMMDRVRIPHSLVSLHSPINLRNELPFDLSLRQLSPTSVEQTLKPGSDVSFFDVDIILELCIPHLGPKWSQRIRLRRKDSKACWCLPLSAPVFGFAYVLNLLFFT